MAALKPAEGDNEEAPDAVTSGYVSRRVIVPRSLPVRGQAMMMIWAESSPDNRAQLTLARRDRRCRKRKNCWAAGIRRYSTVGLMR